MRTITLLLTLLLLQSCHLNHTSPPEDLISEDKMVDILYDFMIINSAQGANKKILESNIGNPINYVFDKYKVDSLQFLVSNTYYSRKINIYNSIYDRVNQKLESTKSDIESQIELQKKEKDSLKKINKGQITNNKKRFISQKKIP